MGTIGIKWFRQAAVTSSALTVLCAMLSVVTVLPGPELAPGQILSELRKGGCVIYLRHAHTDRSRDDAPQPDLKDCATQRMLSHEGEKQADELGAAIRELSVPVGQIYCSPYCRTMETARRALPGRKATEIAELGRLARMARDQLPACNAKLKELLSHQPGPGENTFIVGHSENLAAIGGPAIDEAGWAVFRPGKGGYRLVGKLDPVQWRELVRAAKAKTRD